MLQTGFGSVLQLHVSGHESPSSVSVLQALANIQLINYFRRQVTHDCGSAEGIWLQCDSTLCNVPDPLTPLTPLRGLVCPHGGPGSPGGQHVCETVPGCQWSEAIGCWGAPTITQVTH